MVFARDVVRVRDEDVVKFYDLVARSVRVIGRSTRLACKIIKIKKDSTTAVL